MIINPKASKGKGKINSGAIASYLGRDKRTG